MSVGSDCLLLSGTITGAVPKLWLRNLNPREPSVTDVRKRSGSGNLQSTGAWTQGRLSQPQAVQDQVSTCPRFRTISAFSNWYKPGFFQLRLHLCFKRNHKKCQACVKQGIPEKLSWITESFQAGDKLTLRSVARAALGAQHRLAMTTCSTQPSEATC